MDYIVIQEIQSRRSHMLGRGDIIVKILGQPLLGYMGWQWGGVSEFWITYIHLFNPRLNQCLVPCGSIDPMGRSEMTWHCLCCWQLPGSLDEVNFVYITVGISMRFTQWFVVSFVHLVTFKTLTNSESQWLVASTTSRVSLFIACVRLEAAMLILLICLKGKWGC